MTHSLVHIGRSNKTHARLGMGGSFYGLDHANRQGEADILATNSPSSVIVSLHISPMKTTPSATILNGGGGG